MSTFMLCGRPGKCCPTVERLADKRYKVTDDDGGSVTLTKTELRIFWNTIEKD